MRHLKETMSPPEIAVRWGIKADRVVLMIKRGELKGFDICSHPGAMRPRYRVHVSEVEAFEERRSGVAPAKPLRRRRPKLPADFVHYF